MSARSRRLWVTFVLLVSCFSLVPVRGMAQDDDGSVHRGRKYRPPPETSHIEVMVSRKSNGKPVVNAAVIFHTLVNGKDEGNLEVKTDPDGKATIDVLQIGSTLKLQVFASGYATFAEEYEIAGPEKKIAVTLLRPRAQISAYTDNTGKASERKPGVQEPQPAARNDTSKPPATPPQPAPLPPSERNTTAPVTPQ